MRRKGKDKEVVGEEVVEDDKDIEVDIKEMVEKVEEEVGVPEMIEMIELTEAEGVVPEMIELTELIGTEVTNRNKLVITRDQEWRITKLSGKQEPQYYNICKFTNMIKLNYNIFLT